MYYIDQAHSNVSQVIRGYGYSFFLNKKQTANKSQYIKALL